MDKYPFFVSQNEQDYYPEESCGVASFMMLLKAAQIDPLPTHRQLCDELRLTDPPESRGYNPQDPPVGMYPEDLYSYVVRHNLPFRMHFFNEEWSDCLKVAPIMVLMAGDEEMFGPESHWLVLVDMQSDQFVYLDTWCKVDEQYVMQLSFEEFRIYYTGLALQLLKIKE